LFFFSKKILKKLFGGDAVEGISETGDKELIDPKDFTIRQPLYALVMYIVISIFFLIIYVATLAGSVAEGGDLARAAWFFFLCLSPFILFGPFMIIIWNRWKLVIKDKQISFTSYFGRTKSCSFGDITRLKQDVRATRIGTLNVINAYHEKKKLFYVASNCPGYDVLVQRLKDEGVKIDF